jgi:hypothetical protein
MGIQNECICGHKMSVYGNKIFVSNGHKMSVYQILKFSFCWPFSVEFVFIRDKGNMSTNNLKLFA